MKTPPVLFLIFNRPDLTAKVFSKIRDARPAQLFIAADGPRESREDEAKICEETRAVVSNIDWECEVHQLYRDENLGCKVAVSSAIDWFFEHVEEGIILEDDCLPNPSFFKFCGELLEKYREEPRVGTICGTNLSRGAAESHTSYSFSRFPMIWGWATWRRTWEHYQVNIDNWSELLPSSAMAGMNRYAVRYWKQAFANVASGHTNTWDTQLVFLHFRKAMVSVIPTVNLIENIGFDERGTHSSKPITSVDRLVAEEIGFPLTPPKSMAPNEAFDQKINRLVFKIPNNRYDAVIQATFLLARYTGGKFLRFIRVK